MKKSIKYMMVSALLSVSLNTMAGEWRSGYSGMGSTIDKVYADLKRQVGDRPVRLGSCTHVFQAWYICSAEVYFE